MKKLNDYYNNLWDSLSTDELLSMRKSNVFSKELLLHYKHYMIFRNINDMIPVIMIAVISSFIMNFLVKEKIIQSDSNEN